VSKSILEMPTFHKPCNPLHQSEEPDTELFLWAVPFYTLLIGVVGGKKRTMGEGDRGRKRRGGIGQSSITGRMAFHILFML